MRNEEITKISSLVLHLTLFLKHPVGDAQLLWLANVGATTPAK